MVASGAFAIAHQFGHVFAPSCDLVSHVFGREFVRSLEHSFGRSVDRRVWLNDWVVGMLYASVGLTLRSSPCSSCRVSVPIRICDPGGART